MLLFYIIYSNEIIMLIISQFCQHQNIYIFILSLEIYFLKYNYFMVVLNLKCISCAFKNFPDALHANRY